MGTAAALSVKITADVKDFEKQVKSLERSFANTGSRFQAVGAKLTAGLTLPLAGLALGASKAAIDFEKSFAGVAKTVDGVANKKGQLTAFGKELALAFRNLAKEMPVSVHELNKIGETAGQLGIPRDKILEFTKTMAILGETTNLSSEQAATSIAQIQNIFAASGQNTSNFAAALVAVGNAGASTEADILELSLRLSGAGNQINMTQAEVIGLAAAMADLGINADAGGTAMSTVMSKLSVAADLGGKSLANFAQVAGMEGGAFASLFKQDSTEAIARFIEGLGRVKEEGGNLSKVLMDLGLNDRRVSDMLKRLAGNTDNLRVQLERSRTSWTENTAHMDEFQKRSVTVAAQLEKLWNRVYDLGISLGEVLVPALIRLMPAAESVLQVAVHLVNWFSNLPQPIQTVAIGFFGLVAALGPLSFAFGTIMQTGSALVGLFRTLSGASALAAIAPSANAARAAIMGFGATALAIPGVQVAAAIAGIGVAFALIIPKIKEAIDQFGLWNTVSTNAVAFAQTLPFVGPMFRPSPEGMAQAAALRAKHGTKAQPKDEVAEMIAAMEAQQNLMREVQRRAPHLFGGVGKGMAEASESAKKAAEAAKDWQQELDRLSGREAINVANEWVKKVEAIGGATKLAANDQRTYNQALEDAIDAMLRLNRVVDPRIFDEWLRTALPAIQGGFRFGGTPGQSIKPPNMTDIAISQLPPVVSGFPGGLPGQPMPLPIAPPPPSVWRQIGLDLANTGAIFGASLMDAVFAQGNKLRAFFTSLARNFGDFLGNALSSILKNAMNTAGSFFASTFGRFLGGALQSILPGLGGLLGGLVDKLFGMFGNAGRDLVKDFAASHGGFDALHKQLLAIGPAGEEMWVKLTQGVGRNNPEQAKAAIEAVTDAFRRHEEAVREAATVLPQGAVARSENISSQHDFSTVGAESLGAFTFLVNQGQSAVQAFQAIAPAVEAMRAAMAGNNFEMTAAAERLFALHDILAANKVQFDNLAASGSILSAMLQANIMDAELFSAVALDIGTQIQQIIDKGVPMSQVFALAQPQLQAIWEAQQRWGFAVDDTTAALLAEAEAQGFVGEHMKSVNERILQVLIAIGDVLGATIPDALRGLPPIAEEAAQGMQDAFNKVKGPQIPGMSEEEAIEWMKNKPAPDIEAFDVPQMAAGGIVRARRGGTLVNVGEGGKDEAIVPLSSSGVTGILGGSGRGDVYLDGELVGRVLLPAMVNEAQRLGVS